MDAWSILASLIFSLVGLVYLKQGKTDGDVTKLVCGVALMAFPYFISGVLWIALIGAALTALPFISQRF
mgnify:CR=1 FL=1